MSLQSAVELAEIEFPNMYRLPPKQNIFQRLAAFATPGRRNKAAEVTRRGRQSSQLSGVINEIGEFREDPVSFETLNKMRRHPMVKLATVVRISPIMTALREVRIKCDDPNISAFIQETFASSMLLDLADTSLDVSYAFGVAPHEKVWHTMPVRATYPDPQTGEEIVAWDRPALIYKKIKLVHPETLEGWDLQPKTQDFDGFRQKPAGPGQPSPRVPAWKAFVYTNRFKHGGLWGEAEYTDVYPYWYYSEFFRALLADYLRFKAIPPIIGHAPMGIRKDEDGEEVDNLTYAGEILQSAYDNLVVVLPYETDDGGRNKWGYSELNMSERADVFHKATEELDVMILRGMIVPERTVTQNAAAVGSYNQAEQHAERMVDAAKMEVDNFLKACNTWVIPALVEDNFGRNAPSCRLFSRSFSEDLKEKLFNIVITILQNDRDALFRRQVAFSDLLDFLNIPHTTAPDGMPEIDEGDES